MPPDVVRSLYRRGTRAGVVLGLLLALGAPAAPAMAAAGKPTERSKQKLQAEAERSGLQQKLSALKRDIGKTESAKEDAADTLAESEEAISNANRALRELQQEQGGTNDKLKQLSSEHERLAAVVEQQKKQLARLLREHYVAGNEDRIKLLLSGDNPNRINRDLQMLAYVSQAQALLLASLRANLAAVESNQAATQNAKDELEEIAQEQLQQKALLEKEKGRRAALLSALSTKLTAQRKEAGNLERDEQRMSGLIDKLNQLLAEQAAAAAAEKKRQEQLAAARKAEAEAKAKALAEARERARTEALAKARARAESKAEAERLARANQNKGGTTKPSRPAPADAIDADEPPKVAQQPALPKPGGPVAGAPTAGAPTPGAPTPGAPKPEAPRPEPGPSVAELAARPAPRPADVALAPAAPDGAFASLRGQLRTPVAGKVAARFGAKRGDGPSWKGMFIRAGEGSDIHAIAGGRVVFAEWLRGFGNLIIVDHGGQYMSIYGNNQSLLKRAGDVVKAGDTIASAGNSGGNEESGLYFELRHQGRAFDPATWVKF